MIPFFFVDTFYKVLTKSNYIPNAIDLQFCIGFGLNLNWSRIGLALELLSFAIE